MQSTHQFRDYWVLFAQMPPMGKESPIHYPRGRSGAPCEFPHLFSYSKLGSIKQIKQQVCVCVRAHEHMPLFVHLSFVMSLFRWVWSVLFIYLFIDAVSRNLFCSEFQRPRGRLFFLWDSSLVGIYVFIYLTVNTVLESILKEEMIPKKVSGSFLGTFL